MRLSGALTAVNLAARAGFGMLRPAMHPFDLLHRRRVRPALALLFVEAFLVTLISTGMAWLIFSAASGLIAIFLISLGMIESFKVLLEVNRRDIYEERMTPYSANAWLVLALLAVFLGCFVAFIGVACSLSPDTLRTVFASQLEVSPVRNLELAGMSLGDFPALFSRNISVFFLCLLVSAIYRSGGALIILAWNASVWALSYTIISRSNIALGTASLPQTLVAVVGGVTPHLVLEAAAYASAALVGIFAAKALEKYSWRDPRFFRVVRASLLLVLVGVVFLALGALAESRWPSWWFHLVL
jgi:hypothetical protein